MQIIQGVNMLTYSFSFPGRGVVFENLVVAIQALVDLSMASSDLLLLYPL